MAAIKMMMESRRVISKRCIGLSLLLLSVLLFLWVGISKPYLVHRLATKAFTFYEISQLKYPNSNLADKEITATTKITMATHHIYITADDIDTVREYMENEHPGFVQLHGSRVINEPTYRNTFCVDETAFKRTFQFLEKGQPCIEVNIFPADNSNTSIRYSENWTSMGFPGWLTRW
jgi:hypothetical protein